MLWYLRLVFSALPLVTLVTAEEINISFAGTSALIGIDCTTTDKMIDIVEVTLEKTTSGQFNAANPGTSCVENKASAKIVLDQLNTNCKGQSSCQVTVQNIPSLDLAACPSTTYAGVRFVRTKYTCRSEKILCATASSKPPIYAMSLTCGISGQWTIHIESVSFEKAAAATQGCPPKPGASCSQKDIKNAIFQNAYSSCEAKPNCFVQFQPTDDPTSCPSTTFKGQQYIRIKYTCRELGTFTYTQCIMPGQSTPAIRLYCPSTTKMKAKMFIEKVTMEKAKLSATLCPKSTDNCVLEDTTNHLVKYFRQANCHASVNPCVVSNIDKAVKGMLTADTCKAKGYSGFFFMRIIYSCRSADFYWLSSCVDPRTPPPSINLLPLCPSNKMICIRQLTLARTINRNLLTKDFCTPDYFSLDPYRDDCFFTKKGNELENYAKDQCNVREVCNSTNFHITSKYPDQSPCSAAKYQQGYVYYIITYDCMDRGIYNLGQCCGDCKRILVNKAQPGSGGNTAVSGSDGTKEGAASHQFLGILIGGLLAIPVLLGVIVLVTVCLVKRSRSNDDDEDEDD